MTQTTPRPALVAVTTGSRDPTARPAVEHLLRSVRGLRPGLRVESAALNPATSLPGVLKRISGPVVVLPLLFARGWHVKHLLPARLAASGAAPRATVAACLGPHPLLARALHARLAEAGHRQGSPVVLAAAGSHDPESSAGIQHTADLLADRLGGVPVLSAFATAAGRPSLAEAVAALRDGGHRQVAVASCFVAPGRLADRSAAAGADIVARPLGAHAAMARLLLHRYDQALGGTAPPRRPVSARV